MDDFQKQVLRSISSSLQEASRALVQINNRLAEIGQVLNESTTQPASADSPLQKEPS